MSASIALPAEPTDGLPIPQRYWGILTIALGLTMAVLDGAIANVALPTIASDLNTSAANSIWVVNAYQLAVTISLLPLSSLGDIFGYRRVYQWGLVAFTVASFGCALSWSLPTLAAARVFQGFGAAGIMSVNGALVRAIYPRRWIGRGLGINATIGSIASAAGPTAAAAILSVANWPWLFAINVPLGCVAVAIAWRALPATPSSGVRFDVPAALMSAISLGVLITAIDGVGHGERTEWVILQAVVALAVGAVLVTRELSRSSPLVPVDLMRIPVFALSICTSICAFTAQSMAMVSLPFLFESTLGLGQVKTGLLMTPWPLVVALIAPFTGRLADRYPVGILSGAGLSVLAIGLGLVSLLPAHPNTWDIAWRMLICGFGFGFFNTPNNRAIIISAPSRRSGGASGMQASARLVGQTVGASLVALVFGLFPVNGTTITTLCGAAIAVAAAGVSMLRMMER
ncbi:MAG: MFS transporter [Acetobacteraceae bacterium]|jgi:DHA2 family multidrug resistance protein-like MFS transporter